MVLAQVRWSQWRTRRRVPRAIAGRSGRREGSSVQGPGGDSPSPSVSATSAGSVAPDYVRPLKSLSNDNPRMLAPVTSNTCGRADTAPEPQ